MLSVAQRLAFVKQQISASHVRLVAVSKKQPVALIQEAYAAGHRHFGENYVDELVAKASQLPADVQWHFVGHLQSNKAAALLKVPNLAMIEAVDSARLAAVLDSRSRQAQRQLNVLVQVNTSGETSKAGVAPAAVARLVEDMLERWTALRFAGLMTIGARADERDFATLRQLRATVATQFGLAEASLELSMGMSDDFAAAIRHGSTSIRVGTAIFGVRQT